SSSLPPPASTACTAAASRSTRRVTTPLPSSRMSTVTVASTLQPAATSRSASARKRTKVRLRMRSPQRKRRAGSLALAAGTGQSDRGRLDPFDGAEHDLPVERVDHDRLARVELLPKNLLRQRVLDEPLDGTAQGPGTERRVVPLVGEVQLRLRRELQAQALAF